VHYKDEYKRWLNSPVISENFREELLTIASNEKEIQDRFHTHLSFGTGGLRGVIEPGTNRINIYTIRRATQGLANYILSLGTNAAKKGVVIAYDCRRMSREFCSETAAVLNANGICTYVFDDLRPTPLLSFAVRYLNCIAGIVITASHNPPEYNGYKVYWEDGGQIPPQRAEAITFEINKISNYLQIKTITKTEASGLFREAGSKVDEAYTQAVLEQRLYVEPSLLSVVFSPLHGAGNIPVRNVLKAAGYENVYVVPEQEQSDGNFPTVKYPNPEEREVFTLAEKLAVEKNADIIICTDPDADRLGVAVKDSECGYRYLNGNMTGVLMMEYLLSQKEHLSENDAVISTIVSTDMAKAIADAYGITYFEVLTGFKYIGEKIGEFEKSGSHTYLFGFEESYGYLAGDYVRDKDAVASALLVCDMASYYGRQNMTLWDVLVAMYKKYGYYKETLESITLKDKEGLRNNPPQKIANISVVERRDYMEPIHSLPLSDVLYYTLADGSWVCVRPSGTEPKTKMYFGTKVSGWNTIKEADEKANEKIMAMQLDMRMKGK